MYYMQKMIKSVLLKIFINIFRSSRYFNKHYILNKLGFHLFKMQFKEIIFKLSNNNYNEIYKDRINEIDENGIIVIKNFLSSEDYNQVKSAINVIQKKEYLILYCSISLLLFKRI